MIYLDAAATTFQKPRSVKANLSAAMELYASPGRGGHKLAMAASEKLFQCRERAARLFRVENPEHVS